MNQMGNHFPNSGQQKQTLRIQSPSQMVIGVYNHLLSKVFRFHETILSFGDWIPREMQPTTSYSLYPQKT